MEAENRNKASCPHKRSKTIKKITGQLQIASKSPTAPAKMAPRSPMAMLNPKVHDLLEENNQLRHQNTIYQEYFAQFERRFKEQREQNRHLLNELKYFQAETRSQNEGSDLTTCNSERVILKQRLKYSKSPKANIRMQGQISRY